MNITNILFQNFTGTTSGKYGRSTARLTCSTNPNAVCENIRFKDWNVKTPCGGSSVIICDGIKDGVGMTCVKSSSSEASSALKATCKAPMAKLSSRPWRRWAS